MWTYSDYITIDDPTARLTRLRLHIQEVSDRIVSVTSRAGDVSPVDPNYLKELKSEEKDLCNRTQTRNFARTKARFSHG